MPQPCDPQRRLFPSKLTLLRPGCAAQLSAAVVEWAHVERVLSRMLRTAMGPQGIESVPGTAGLGSWVASGVMSTLDSTHAKLLVIQAVLVPLLPEGLAQLWTDLEKEYRACAKQRNLIAHTAWTISDEFPDDLIREDSKGRISRYTARDFSEVGDRISELRKSLERFLSDLVAASEAGRCGFR